ncbi:hypothetical protein GCM10022225_25060 [Plantactinospora mayteni]|uniref:Mce-associated membrane protein n=1 Tax=Plantactinospora mayteni TaxID=566021 RepID=A0ABQ4EJ51_9ACTN|nr:hypothetical protein [Plantactinospora mayteni]GIG94764.1 hypothetical protein Pma05_13370 [Plantactinospora mayteni]
MPSGEERRLKLVKGTAPAEPSTPAVPRQAPAEGRGLAGGARRSADGTRQPGRGGRAATRRTVTRRLPAVKHPVEEILERLDQEPVDKPPNTGEPTPTDDPNPTTTDEATATDEVATTDKATARDEAGTTDEAGSTDEAGTSGGTGSTRRTTRSGRAGSTDAAGSTDERAAGRKGAGRRLGTTVTLVVALCAALALAGVFGFRWWEDRAVERAHAQALAAARQTTVNFVSVSASSVDGDLQRITAGATGEFKEEFVRGQAKVREAVLENKVESRGTVLRAGLLSGDRRHAVVLVAMDATVKNVNAPDGRPAHYRIQVDLTREGDSDTWLVSRLQFVG